MKALPIVLLISILFTACGNNNGNNQNNQNSQNNDNKENKENRECLVDGGYNYAHSSRPNSNPDILIKNGHYTEFRDGVQLENGKIENDGNCNYRLTTEKWTDPSASDYKKPGDVETWKIELLSNDTLSLDFDAPGRGQSGKGIKLVRIRNSN